MFALEQISQDNQHKYTEYEKAFEADLKEYQSRIYPSKDTEKLCWYHIKHGESYIGAIWLEKNCNDDFSVLGIFIADKAHRNQGIGTKAIQQILKEDLRIMDTDKVVLRVRENNKRAVACYSKIGFKETGRYTKNGIKIIEMSLLQNNVRKI